MPSLHNGSPHVLIDIVWLVWKRLIRVHGLRWMRGHGCLCSPPRGASFSADGGGGWWWQPSAPPQTLPVSPRQISCTLLNHPLADSLQFHIKTWPCYFDYYASSQIPSLLTSFGIFLSFFPFPSCMTLIFIFPSVKKNKRWRWCSVLRNVCVCVSIQLHPIQSALGVWLQNRCWQFNIHGNLQNIHSVTSNHIVLNLLRQ